MKRKKRNTWLTGKGLPRLYGTGELCPRGTLKDLDRAIYQRMGRYDGRTRAFKFQLSLRTSFTERWAYRPAYTYHILMERSFLKDLT